MDLGFKGHRVKNDPKVFKHSVGNDLEISYKWYGFGLKGQGYG